MNSFLFAVIDDMCDEDGELDIEDNLSDISSVMGGAGGGAGDAGDADNADGGAGDDPEIKPSFADILR